jgi:integrase
VRDGRDPRNERTEAGVLGNARSTPLFKPLAHELLAKLVFKNDKSRACWKRTIDIHFKALHDKPMHEITVDDIVAVLHPLYVNIPSIGREARQRLESILESAIVKHPTVMGRNVATRSILKATRALPKLPRKGEVRGDHKSLHHSLLPEFWVELRAINSVSSKALQLLILTCLRSGELLQMNRKQVVNADKYEKGALRLLLPGKMMKSSKRGENGVEADIPLTPAAIRIVNEMEELLADQPQETLLFPSQAEPGKYGVELSKRTLLNLLQTTLGYSGKGHKPLATVHGFRGSFKTWADEETEHADQVTEFALHHLSGDAAKEAYKKGPMWRRRKAALIDWANYVTSLERKQADPSNVVPFAA